MLRTAFIALLLTGCATVDLRPQTPPTDADRDAGRALLRGVADAHGGRAAWLARPAVRVHVRDRWKSLMHTLVGPWPKNGTLLELTFAPGTDNGRIRFAEVDGPDWGIQHWRTYRVKDGEAVFARDRDIEFWIPTVSYFVQAPFRLVEATTVYRMPPATVGTTTYDRVFATWGDDAPQETVDQYVVWIDPATRRIAWLQYTVRDYGGWMMGIMAYEDYVDIDGFKLARTMGTVDEPGGKPTLHRFTVESFDVDAVVDPTYLVPRPDLRGTKH